ncbi:MAG TPA: GTPase HflX [Candidatus Thermoplasmatota archaeon]
MGVPGTRGAGTGKRGSGGARRKSARSRGAAAHRRRGGDPQAPKGAPTRGGGSGAAHGGVDAAPRAATRAAARVDVRADARAAEAAAGKAGRAAAAGPWRRALLLSTSRVLGEILDLAKSLPLSIEGIQIQERDKPDPRTYFGSGKVGEVAAAAKASGCDLLLVNDLLRPSQLLNLQRETKLEVWDRVMLILQIFTDRARSAEAQLQVERADLQNQIPIVREAISQSKRGENPGFLAGGQVGTEPLLNQIRRRIKAIDERLAKLQLESGRKRERRKRSGYFVVSVAGYTNAGKSTLVSAITGSPLLIEDRMFSTLTTTTRKVSQLNGVVLMSDTVGFIESLPPFMIEAFNSTISEIYSSDLILLVVDVSEDDDTVERKLLVSARILEANEDPPPVVVVLNKTDEISVEAVAWKVRKLKGRGLIEGGHYVAASAKSRDGVRELLDLVTSRIERLTSAVIELEPLSGAGVRETILSWLFDNCVAVSVPSPWAFQVTCDESVLKRARARLDGSNVQYSVRVLPRAEPGPGAPPGAVAA